MIFRVNDGKEEKINSLGFVRGEERKQKNIKIIITMEKISSLSPLALCFFAAKKANTIYLHELFSKLSPPNFNKH